MPEPIKCVVACHGGDGPTFCYVVVNCTQEQYDDGQHYEVAKDHARDMNFDGPMVVYDEHDGPDWLFASNEWHGMTPVACEEAA